MNACRYAAAIASLALAHAALGADLAGAKDPAGFQRYRGAEIIYYVERSYDQYTLARGDGAPGGGFAKIDSVEGAATRVFYRVAAGHTALELLRNYEQMLVKAGYAVTFELTPCGAISWSGYFFDKYYKQLGATGDNPFHWASGSSCYATAKALKAGKQVSVAVLVGEVPGGFNWHGAGPAPIDIKDGEILVGVDVVTGEPFTDKMAIATSGDLAKALAQKGAVDIYGVLFDVDKTDVKPQSASTLAEVAKLLKGDPKLKLEISGHTDDTGGADHNLALSQGRAEAVIAALVKTYGIDAARLQAKGYGDTKPVSPNNNEAGRAKNRRVELRKI